MHGPYKHAANIQIASQSLISTVHCAYAPKSVCNGHDWQLSFAARLSQEEQRKKVWLMLSACHRKAWILCALVLPYHTSNVQKCWTGFMDRWCVWQGGFEQAGPPQCLVAWKYFRNIIAWTHCSKTSRFSHLCLRKENILCIALCTGRQTC